MSNGNGGNGGLPTDFPLPTGFDEAALGDLVHEMSEVVDVTQGQCDAPSLQFTIPKQATADLFRWICGFLKEFGVWDSISHFVAGLAVAPLVILNVFLSVTITVFAPAVAAFVTEILELLDSVRKTLDPEVAKVAVNVLNEFLGTDITPDDMPSALSIGGHLARADKLGGVLHDQLLSEFGAPSPNGLQPSADAARRFTGLAINFGVANGIIGTIGGMVPEVHLDEVREMGEQVARNLGLGRLQRLALQPLVKTLIGTPYQWKINQDWRPTQFTIGDVVNPFTQQLMSPDVIHSALALQGYSDDKIAALIALHQKRAPEAGILRAYRYKEIGRFDAISALQALSYTQTEANKVVTDYERQRQDPHVEALVAAMLEAYKFGNIDSAGFQNILDNLPLLPQEVTLITSRAAFGRKSPHRSLTVAQLELALQNQIIDFATYDNYLATLGFSDQDSAVVEALALIKIDTAEAKAKAAAAKAAAKATPPAPASTTPAT